MGNWLTPSRVVTLAIVGILGILPVACGGGNAVEGNTYVDNGNVVKIEFKSGGKAFVSTGPVTNTCTYSQASKTVTLTCDGDKTDFAVDADGALNGPPGGMLARLTKQSK